PAQRDQQANSRFSCARRFLSTFARPLLHVLALVVSLKCRQAKPTRELMILLVMLLLLLLLLLLLMLELLALLPPLLTLMLIFAACQPFDRLVQTYPTH